MNNSLRQLLLEKAIQHSSQYSGVQDKRLQDEQLERNIREGLRKEKIKQDIVLDQFERKRYMPLDMILKQSKQGQQVRRIIVSALNDINKNKYDGVLQKIGNLSNLVKSEDLDDSSLQSINNFLSGIQKRASELQKIGKFPGDNYEGFMADISSVLNNISNKDTLPEKLEQDLRDFAQFDDLLKIFNEGSSGKFKVDEKKKILEEFGAPDVPETSRHERINEYGKAFVRSIQPITEPISVLRGRVPKASENVVSNTLTGRIPTASVRLQPPVPIRPPKGTSYIESIQGRLPKGTVRKPAGDVAAQVVEPEDFVEVPVASLNLDEVVGNIADVAKRGATGVYNYFFGKPTQEFKPIEYVPVEDAPGLAGLDDDGPAGKDQFVEPHPDEKAAPAPVSAPTTAAAAAAAAPTPTSTQVGKSRFDDLPLKTLKKLKKIFGQNRLSVGDKNEILRENGINSKLTKHKPINKTALIYIDRAIKNKETKGSGKKGKGKKKRQFYS